MDDMGFWEHLVRDLSGKGQIRLILQPAMAIFLGIRIGLSDARSGASPFVRHLVESKDERWRLVGQSIRYAWLPLTIAFVVDCILQYLTLGRIRPLAAVVVGILLVYFPFTAARGFSNRIYRRLHRSMRRA